MWSRLLKLVNPTELAPHGECPPECLVIPPVEIAVDAVHSPANASHCESALVRPSTSNREDLCSNRDKFEDSSHDKSSDSDNETDSDRNQNDLEGNLITTSDSSDAPIAGSFSSFKELHDVVKQFANSHIFGLSRNFRNFTKSEFSKEYGDIEFINVPRRGYFYCSSCGLPDSGNRDRFRIQVTFNSNTHAYEIDQSLCHYEHNHPMKTDESRASSRILISHQNQMSDSELQYLLELGASSIDIAKAREMMRSKFNGRDYDGPMLFRVLKKGYENVHGSDYDAVNQLLDMGNKYRSEGGIFDFRIGSDMRIIDIIIAKPSMIPYLKMYGDVIIMDGTHGCDTYGMIAIINTLIDCLGLSVISSYSHCRSENADHILRSLRTLQLDGAGTLISDNNPAFNVICQDLHKIHLLCVKHYSDKIFSYRAGLSSQLSEQFVRDMNDLIFKDMLTPDELHSQFSRCLEVYASSAKAVEFTKKLEQDQTKVCRTHTSQFFSAGAVATQRGEGSNSRLKNQGRKKAELRKFNLFQFAQHAESLIELQEQRTLQIIQKLVKGVSKQCRA
jgi:hypothetical protein